MSIEQNLNNSAQEQIINNGEVIKEAPVTVIDEEAKEAKAVEMARRKIVDGQNIDKIKDAIMNEFANGDKQERIIDPLTRWKENEIKKIKDKARQMKEKTVDVAISDRGPVSSYDEGFALASLEDYKELKFINFAIKEGNQEDKDYALKLLDIYYRDRDDLKKALKNRI